MKLIKEAPTPIKFIKENNSADTNNNGDIVYIEGVFATINTKNNNKRVYSKQVWENAIDEYIKNTLEKGGINSLMEWEHADSVVVNPMNAVAKIEYLKIDGDYVIGKAKLLDNEKANKLKNILNEGISIGVSSRGVGELDAMGNVYDFSLITFDCVSDPSDSNAVLNTKGFKDGVFMNESYIKDNLGNFIKEDINRNINIKNVLDYINQLKNGD